jgi:RNA polymerase sigma factor (sigma-70 family)
LTVRRTDALEVPRRASLSDQELEDLVRAAASGGGWAFERIWQELSPAVAGYARSRGVRDVDDVVSGAFLAAFQGITGFRGSGKSFRSWLFTIAHHKIVDELRTQHRRSVEEELIGDAMTPAVPSAESAALAALSDDDVRRLLDGLTADQRDVLLLRVFGDLPLAEVARVIGRSEGAVKQLQHRAIEQLRKRVSPPTRAAGIDRGRPVTAQPVAPITEMP